MSKLIWFAFGFTLVLVAAAAVLMGPLLQTHAVATLPPPEPTPPQGGAGSDAPVLQWEWSSPLDCGKLRVERLTDLYVAPCGGAYALAEPTEEELRALLGHVARYAPFEYVADASPTGGMDAVRMAFAGRGGHAATPEERAEVAAWARGVFDRLAAEERLRRATAAARVALALRLGLWTDAIAVVEADDAVWPDACLGVPEVGHDCAQVRTPGYRVVLAHGGEIYVYHTDAFGSVRLAEARAATPTPDPEERPPVAAPTEAAPTPEAETEPPAEEPPPPTEAAPPAEEPPSPTEALPPTEVPPPTEAPPTETPMPSPTPAGHWTAEYYDNPELRGDPVHVAHELTLSHAWGEGSPAPDVPPDYFSARWTQRVHLEPGRYDLRVEADDGVRLWVSGALLVDRWHGGRRVDVVSGYEVSDPEQEIVVEYLELEGEARIRLSWERAQTEATPPPEGLLELWRGEYYAGADLDGKPLLVRDEPQVAFDWGEGSPDDAVPAESFSARYTRRVNLEPGEYRLTAVADDGVRVYVDGALVIDGWGGADGRVLVRETRLGGGHAFQVEFHKVSGSASLSFGWACLEGPTATPTP